MVVKRMCAVAIINQARPFRETATPKIVSGGIDAFQPLSVYLSSHRSRNPTSTFAVPTGGDGPYKGIFRS